jgi:phospho-N-acetylmuramoyl-pentapeptide-transferase
MHTQLIYLLTAVLFTAFLYPFWINFVYKYHMGEQVRGDGPATHLKKSGTPTMGGLVFIFSVALITFLLNRSRTQTLFPVLVASMAGFFGLIEDFGKIYKTDGFRTYVSGNILTRLPLISKLWSGFKEFWRVVGSSTDVGLQTYQKFLIQGFIGGFVALWAYFKLGWDYIWFPLLGNVHIGWLYPIVIFFLFIVVLNSVAFTDGLDGLAGGLGLIAFVAFWVIAGQLEYNSLAAFAATFVGALLPFLYFNVNPARIFMGNVGSHVLGATLVTLGVVMHREVAMLLVLAVFLFDGISSPVQQISYVLTKKRLFRMAPIHHHFELLGWPETKVTLRFWLAGGLFAFIGILVALL